jgi:hypothetical protein
LEITLALSLIHNSFLLFLIKYLNRTTIDSYIWLYLSDIHGQEFPVNIPLYVYFIVGNRQVQTNGMEEEENAVFFFSLEKGSHFN